MKQIDTIYGTIYFALEDFMERNGVTQVDLAEILEKSYNQAGNIKHGKFKSLTMEMIAALCKHFNCQPGQLFQYQNPTGSKIKGINELDIVSTIGKIKDMSSDNNIAVSIHVIYYKEDDYILFGSPELDIFSDFRAPSQPTHTKDFQKLVMDELTQIFQIKKGSYSSFDDFIMEMQRLNHWRFNAELNSFEPMPLEFYIKNYSIIERMVNDRPSQIFRTRVMINLDKSTIDFRADK
jgi:DNA-binding Xre family transcriptional regulator